jgi:hypothetical protein
MVRVHAARPAASLSLRAMLILLIFASIVGCQRAAAPQRVAVSGEVRCGEVPLSHGLIRFKPLASGSGPAASTAIEAGIFRFNERNGPPPGRYEVVIQPVVDGKRLPTSTNDSSAFARSASGPTHGPWTLEVDVPAQKTFEMPFTLQ